MPTTFQIGAIDLAIPVLYLIGSRVLALWLTRGKSEDTDGFFLGRRNFVGPVIGFSLFAIHFLYASGASFVLSIVLLVVVSLATARGRAS